MTTTDRPADVGRTSKAPSSSRTPWRPGFFSAALAGIISVGVAIGVAEMLAALGGWWNVLNPSASPINALGSSFINLTPEWLKEFAIRTFGQHDKDALRLGMAATLVVVAAIVGVIARRSPRIAVGVTAVLIVVTLVAIFSRTGSGAPDALPILIGGAVGVFFLVTVFRRTVSSEVSAAGAAAPTAFAGSPALDSHSDSESESGTTSAAIEDPKTATSGERHPMTIAIARSGLDRRQFFRLAAAGAALAAVGGALARWIPSGADVAASQAKAVVPKTTDTQIIPAGVDLKVPEQPPFITPNASFYRVDTAFTLPNLTAEDWSLKVHGMVDNEMSLNYTDLVSRPQIERTITLTCVSNEVGGDLAGNATWIGARIDDLLKEAKVQSGADCVLCTSVDGFTISAPLDALTDGRDALLAVSMNGEILPQAHGFPVRMVVPGIYGYVSATKWVVDMEVTQFSKVSAYWTSRGWADRAPIKTASRIDVPKGFAQYSNGQQVTFAGVAWAQHRGIQSVDVQIDDGPWQPAVLSESFSSDTWRQWKFGWKATSGLHTVRCRAIDGTGAVQISDSATPMPNGSTGLDSRSVTVS